MVHALPTTKSHRDLVRLGCSQQSCKLSLMALLPCGCLSFGNSAFLLTSAVIVATSGLHMNGKVLCSSTVTTLTSAIKNPGVDHHHDVRLSRGDMSARIPSLGELEGDREPGPVLVTRRDPSVLLSESRACLQIAVRVVGLLLLMKRWEKSQKTEGVSGGVGFFVRDSERENFRLSR